MRTLMARFGRLPYFFNTFGADAAFKTLLNRGFQGDPLFAGSLIFANQIAQVLALVREIAADNLSPNPFLLFFGQRNRLADCRHLRLYSINVHTISTLACLISAPWWHSRPAYPTMTAPRRVEHSDLATSLMI